MLVTLVEGRLKALNCLCMHDITIQMVPLYSSPNKERMFVLLSLGLFYNKTLVMIYDLSFYDIGWLIIRIFLSPYVSFFGEMVSENPQVE